MYTIEQNVPLERKFTRSVGEAQHFDADGELRSKSLTLTEAQLVIEKLQTAIPELAARGTINLVFSNRKTRNLNGKAWFHQRKIKLFPNGQNEKTLIHELAHILHQSKLKNGRWDIHGAGFKIACDKIVRVWKEIR